MRAATEQEEQQAALLPQQHGAAFVSTLAHMGKKIRSRWPEWTALSFYAALVAFAIPFHEPWADEAQAWQLARSLSLGSLFKTYIRYEGSPGLWYFLLWAMNRVHIGYIGLHWICGGIAVGATALLVLKSPFPRYLKLSLPFTYFLLFQYAVVARSYVLVPPLLYLIALCWKKRPLVPALLLGLLANVALHAAVISGGLAIVYLVEQIRIGGAKEPRRMRQLVLGAIILLPLCALALWTAWPVKDNSFYSVPAHWQWQLVLIGAGVSLIKGTCDPWILSVFCWVAISLCFLSRRRFFYLLPVLFLAAFSGAVHFEWWHVGLLMPLVSCLLWITWPAAADKASLREAVGRIALVIMATVQILWSAYAIEFDHYNAYSPDLAAAEFLRPLAQEGATIAVTYMSGPEGNASRSVGILPYFDHSIFANEPDSFWWWSSRNSTEKMFMEILPSHPSVIVVEVRSNRPNGSISLEDEKTDVLRGEGYTFTNMFCGTMPQGFQVSEKSCHLIFQRPGNPQRFSQNQLDSGSVAR